MPLSDEDIREILRIIDETPLAELRLETDGFSLHVVKGGAEAAASASATERAPSSAPEPSAPATAPTGSSSPDPPSTATGIPSPTDNLVTIDAPMLGVFYQADSPGGEPFVEPGSRVAPDTTVCIIEVMKMMNSVPAGVTGTLVEVCQENGAIVEEGAPLFSVRPE